jgi:FkbM family methyltransferase
MFTRPIDVLTGGSLARLAVKLIGTAGVATAPIHHRLYWRFCNLLAHPALSLAETHAVVALAPDCRMKVFLSDPYWARLIAASYEYEPDFKRVLRELAQVEYTFIDCGANFGYWSILVSGEALGAHPTLAIEACRDNCEILRENCALNANRFAVLYRAISDRSGIPVRMESHGGASAHIQSGDARDATGPVVLTSTLDDVICRHFGEWPRRLVVKLDVEGQEINAFKGAHELLNREVLFYYEDHGKDRSSSVTRYVLEELGLTVLYCPPAGPLQAIGSVQTATKVKTRKTYGYNFLACRAESDFIDALEPLFLGT